MAAMSNPANATKRHHPSRRPPRAPGITHIYTGNGKGKTTAALGLILRACGRGFRICLTQFLKKGQFGEIIILKSRFPEVTILQHGHGPFVRGKPSAVAIRLAREGFQHLKEALRSGNFDLIVADELVTAVTAGLIPEDDVLTLIREVPPRVELVITGRGATANLIAAAGLVTEMREVKHYYHTGTPARRGIEM
jgi:cob(I)alamin adenosyltransferase